MNDKLQKYARSELKSGLKKLPESNQLLFKRMYSHKDLTKSIDDIIDLLEEDKLDRAMQQVERTLRGAENVLL